MKKLLTSAFFALSILTVAASNDLKTVNEQATDISRRMANQVELNEMEYIQIKKFTAEKLTSVDQIKKMYSNDKEMMIKKIGEVEAAYNYRIQNLLSAKQFETFASLQNSYKTNLTIIAAGE